jgi:riboflavin transporter
MKSNHKNIQKLTLASMFTALAVMLASPIFSYMIMLFGVPAVRVDLIALPVILAGLILGPIYGLSVGIVTDVLGFLLFTHLFGPYHYGFTINLALTGFISGGFIHLVKQESFKKVPVVFINFILLTLTTFVGIIYLLINDTLTINGVTHTLSPIFKIFFISSLIIFYSILLISIRLTRKKHEHDLIQLDRVIFIVVFIEIFVVTLLTPIWVLDLYQAPPYLAGVFIRVVRSMWLIPIKSYIVYYIYKVSKMILGQQSLIISSKK